MRTTGVAMGGTISQAGPGVNRKDGPGVKIMKPRKNGRFCRARSPPPDAVLKSSRTRLRAAPASRPHGTLLQAHVNTLIVLGQ